MGLLHHDFCTRIFTYASEADLTQRRRDTKKKANAAATRHRPRPRNIMTPLPLSPDGGASERRLVTASWSLVVSDAADCKIASGGRAAAEASRGGDAP